MRKKARIPKRKMSKQMLTNQVFAPLYKLIKDIDMGEVDEVEGHIVIDRNKAIPEIKNILMSAPEYLKAWCDVFDSIGTVANVQFRSENLRNIAGNLYCEKLIFNERDLKAAKIELDEMVDKFKKIDQKTIDKGLSLVT